MLCFGMDLEGWGEGLASRLDSGLRAGPPIVLQNPVMFYVVGIVVLKVIRLIFMMVDSLDSATRELKSFKKRRLESCPGLFGVQQCPVLRFCYVFNLLQNQY